MARRARQFSQRPASNPSSAMISCTSLCARHCHPLPLRCTRRCSSSHGDVEMAEHTHAPHTRARAKEWTWRTHSAPTARASLWSSRIVVPRGHGAMTHATSRRGRGTLSSGARDAISKQQLWQLVRSSGVRATNSTHAHNTPPPLRCGQYATHTTQLHCRTARVSPGGKRAHVGTSVSAVGHRRLSPAVAGHARALAAEFVKESAQQAEGEVYAARQPVARHVALEEDRLGVI